MHRPDRTAPLHDDRPQYGRDDAVVGATISGDKLTTFDALVARYHREIHVHCYRMLGSLEDADDLTQETFLRAWRYQGQFEGRSSYRRWLYRIATNACLDFLRRRRRRVLPVQVIGPSDPKREPSSSVEEPWIEPYPDHLLAKSPVDHEPQEVAVSRETMSLAFITAIQILTPKQRAVFVLQGALGWSAKDTAALLDTTVPAANSALQRARAVMREHLSPRSSEWSAPERLTPEEERLLRRYIDAHENGDHEVMANLLADDARLSMPPSPTWYQGRDAIIRFHRLHVMGTRGAGVLRLVPTMANRQPAAGVYFRPPGEATYEAAVLDVLRVASGKVAEITAFIRPDLFPAFGLPPRLRV